jgi:RNA polymerase sigma-70 factor (ECF subfamily)
MEEPSEPDEKELVERARGGDGAALEALLAREGPPLIAMIIARMGDELRRRVEPEDILQETFAWATRSIRRFEWRGPGSFHQWLRGIASHMLLKAARGGKRLPRLRLEREPTGDEPSPSRLLRRGERFERLRRAIDELSPEHREVLLLARIEGLPVQEIARRLGRTPNAVSLLIGRALKKLKERFGETESLHLPPRRLGNGGAVDDEQ